MDEVAPVDAETLCSHNWEQNMFVMGEKGGSRCEDIEKNAN